MKKSTSTFIVCLVIYHKQQTLNAVNNQIISAYPDSKQWMERYDRKFPSFSYAIHKHLLSKTDKTQNRFFLQKPIHKKATSYCYLMETYEMLQCEASNETYVGDYE
jgi:hypothetical protein